MNPRSHVPWVPITKVHRYVTQSTKVSTACSIPSPPKEKQEFQSYTCIEGKDSALRKQRGLFFLFSSGLRQIFFFFLNSLILKLLDEKGKSKTLHELLPSLPKK